MRPRRLKFDASSVEAYYHCISRTAGSAWLLNDHEKETFRKHLWATIDYCGLELVTYAIMSNHYHVLLKVPFRKEIGDEELLRRYERFYPQRRSTVVAVRADMARNGEYANAWRHRQLQQMFDVSAFNKLLKMRFSIWFNSENDRKGTLWESRFTSVIVEEGTALRAVAAYIDLNAAKAGIVEDPKDYRYSGYAEAVSGNEQAQKGLQLAHGVEWPEAEIRHRFVLFGSLHDKGRLSPERARQIINERGRLSLPEILRCKIRYFVQGHVLGTQDYVSRVAKELMPPRPVKGIRRPYALAPIADWDSLRVLSPMRTALYT